MIGEVKREGRESVVMKAHRNSHILIWYYFAGNFQNCDHKYVKIRLINVTWIVSSFDVGKKLKMKTIPIIEILTIYFLVQSC